MPSLNIAVVGEDAALRESICKELAKKGSSDEIAFYNSIYQGKIITCLDPVQFPQKIASLVFSLSLSNYCVLAANAVSPAVGEAIIALDLLGKKSGCVVSENPDLLAPLLKNTALESWNRFSSITEARTEVLAFEPPMLDGPVKGVIDHAFEVKGVGSVALGVLLRGRLRVHDKLALYPSMKTIEVRSIQKQDHDVQSAECWDRFGISFKGASSDDVRKGDFLSARPLQVVEALEAEVEATKFLREPIGKSEGKETLHACVGLQVVPCVVEGQVKPGAKTKCRVSLQKPLAFEAGDTALFLRLDAKTLRVAGKAVL